MTDLTGKVAVVTGGSRGLGHSMVFALAAAGADVVIASRKLEACESVANAVREQTGRQAMAYAVNVSHWDQIEPMVDAIYDRFGRVDVLVNNAGMSPLYPSLVEVSEALFDKVVGINMKGPFRLAALVGARMAAGDGGSIINVSSHASQRPRPEFLPYAMAKAGLNAMTVGLAHGFGPKVRVNCIMAGPFRTDASASWADNAPNNDLQRIGEPDEIIGATLYFASEASSFTTGAILAVHGGLP